MLYEVITAARVAGRASSADHDQDRAHRDVRRRPDRVVGHSCVSRLAGSATTNLRMEPNRVSRFHALVAGLVRGRATLCLERSDFRRIGAYGISLGFLPARAAAVHIVELCRGSFAVLGPGRILRLAA